MVIKRGQERNIKAFNNDIAQVESYLYTRNDIYSALIATQKQTDEMVNLIKKYFSKNIKIADIGCGDGKYTIELYKSLSPSIILGVDPAGKAIEIAKKRIIKKYKGRVLFKVGDIYQTDKLFKRGQFDLATIRGTLHHLYRPKVAIQHISNVFSSVVVLEPNGYNPVLKILEKVSPYHREHEEKSYWPPMLNEWFEALGYKVIDQKFFGLVPYFCPETIAKLLKSIEVPLENIAILNKLYCGTNLILYKKNSHG